jgi:hypothetical protein
MEYNLMAITGGKTLQVFVTADLKKFNSGLNQAQGGLKGFAGTMSSMVGPALIATAAAAGALAIKFGVEGVKAAMDDEASLNKLAQTLTNVGLAHDQPMVEDFISGLERSLGVADDELRPAYDRLVRSTKDVGEANSAMSLALDIAAGSHNSLKTVTDALGKAYDGNAVGLSKLGIGLDRATLASGDMEKITGAAAEMFAGQATTSAQTFQGQIKRLTTATDNMKEAFGQGLLSALGDTNKQTQDLVDIMQDLEPLIGGVGTAVGTLATSTLKSYNDAITRTGDKSEKTTGSVEGLAVATGGFGTVLGEIFGSLTGPNSPLGFLFRGLGKTEVAAVNLANTVVSTIPSFRDYRNEIRLTTDEYIRFLDVNKIRLGIIKEENKDYKDLAERQRDVNTFTHQYTGVVNTNTGSVGGNSTAVVKLTEKQKELLKTNEALGIRFAATSADLDLQKTKLEEAAQAVTDYAGNIQKNLLGGIDLEAAFTGQFNDAGEATGVSLLEGFNKQIDQANAFGNVLVKIRDAGGDSEFINAIASLGPVTGTALATQLIDDGLVPTMSDKFVGVRESTALLAMSIVPDFLLAGVEAGVETVNGLATQLSKEGNRLTKIGKKIAKPVGQAFKSQLADDVAEALRSIEAAGTAGRAEVVAKAEARQVAITEQQVALALSNLVRKADSRSGAVVRPVLA